MRKCRRPGNSSRPCQLQFSGYPENHGFIQRAVRHASGVFRGARAYSSGQHDSAAVIVIGSPCQQYAVIGLQICTTGRLGAHLTPMMTSTTKRLPVADNDATGKLHIRGLTQSTNLCVETALVSSSFVFVNQTLTSHVIQYWSCFFQRSFCRAFIARGDSRKNTLYHSAHHRALACVALTRFFGLANAFACLSSVGHGLSSNLSVRNSAAHYPPGFTPRQRPNQ